MPQIEKIIVLNNIIRFKLLKFLIQFWNIKG